MPKKRDYSLLLALVLILLVFTILILNSLTWLTHTERDDNGGNIEIVDVSPDVSNISSSAPADLSIQFVEHPSSPENQSTPVPLDNATADYLSRDLQQNIIRSREVMLDRERNREKMLVPTDNR